MHTGVHVTAADAERGRLTLTDEAGWDTVLEADLVVGADGLHSTARATWPEDPGVREVGYAAWRAVTEESVDVAGVCAETWGTHARFGVVPLHDGRVYWFAVQTIPERRPRDPHAADLDALFGSWHAPIPALLAATDPSAVRYLPIAEHAGDLPTFVRGRAAPGTPAGAGRRPCGTRCCGRRQTPSWPGRRRW